jgi:hypothetical protein
MEYALKYDLKGLIISNMSIPEYNAYAKEICTSNGPKILKQLQDIEKIMILTIQNTANYF